MDLQCVVVGPMELIIKDEVLHSIVQL